jgi:hypothetical protein
MGTTRLFVIMGMVLATATWRVVPHAWNLAPVGALALFAGATLTPRWVALLVPLVAMALSDLVLYALRGYPADPAAYLSYVLIVGIGFWLRSRRTVLPIAFAALASSVLFFAITNFAVWLTGGGLGREHTFSGLILCYIDAIPFFQNTLLGDLLFTVVLFGGLALIEFYLPELREKVLAPVTERVPQWKSVEKEECMTADQ